MKTKPKIKQSFDKGAKNYESNSDIQRLICHQLVNFFLEKKEKITLSECIKGLDLGAGNGILSIELLKFIKFEKLHLIDFSDKMLELAKKKIKQSFVTYEVTDFEDLNEIEKFNFIFSNMSFHWSKNFNVLLKKLLEKISNNTLLFFSIPNSIYFEKKEPFSNLDNLMNKFPDIKNLLNELDKTKYFLESKNITFKENFNNLLSFFYKLRSIGANVNTENRKKSLIRFRKQKTNLSVSYNINFVLIKKL